MAKEKEGARKSGVKERTRMNERSGGEERPRIRPEIRIESVKLLHSSFAGRRRVISQSRSRNKRRRIVWCLFLSISNLGMRVSAGDCGDLMGN